MFGSRTSLLDLEMDQIPAFSLRHARNRIESARCDEGLLGEESRLAADGKQVFDDRCSLECGRGWRLRMRRLVGERAWGCAVARGPAKVRNCETVKLHAALLGAAS